jgi:hypothetical protein
MIASKVVLLARLRGIEQRALCPSLLLCLDKTLSVRKEFISHLPSFLAPSCQRLEESVFFLIRCSLPGKLSSVLYVTVAYLTSQRVVL